MSKESSSSRGIGFVGLLTIVFIVLKLTNYIDWSWWWVLSPMWIGTCVSLLICLIAVVIFFVGKRRKGKNPKTERTDIQI